MSMRLEMLQVARLAPKVLGDSIALVRGFLHGQEHPDGGFHDRAGRSDLYYTVFGVDSLLALQDKPQSIRLAAYVSKFGDGAQLDFVHLCCLARCWAVLRDTAPLATDSPHSSTDTAGLLNRIEQYRASDGGYDPSGEGKFGTAYGCFLALSAYQDLKVTLPQPLKLVQCLKWLEIPDGSWANDRVVKIGSTNATAAVVTMLRQLNMPINGSVADWLLARLHLQGGFCAVPDAPVPDLLSTATALHALSGLEVDLEPVQDRCLDFIDTLWTNNGSFHGNWTDDELDCEYTFYGLLALGHLSF